MGWVVNLTPRPLYPRERPGTHYIGGWMGPWTGLDGCGKSRPHRDSIPEPSSPGRVAIPTELYRPMEGKCNSENTSLYFWLQHNKWNQGVFSRTFLSEISKAYPALDSPQRVAVLTKSRRTTWPDYASNWFLKCRCPLLAEMIGSVQLSFNSCGQGIEKRSIGFFFCENIVDFSVYALLCG